MFHLHPHVLAMQNPKGIGKTREKKLQIDWSQVQLHRPKELGIKTLKDIAIEDIVSYIDWSPFFKTWMLKGRYPKILDDKIVGEEAQKLYDDAQ